MSSQQLDEEAIFQIARQLEAVEARSTYLDQVCAGDQALRQRVEALLEIHDKESNFLKSAESDPDSTLDQPSLPDATGEQIGPYKLLQQIGEGGFGVVYMAEQKTPVKRRVALKIIKPGMDSQQVLARFEAERQALAMMDHPNIAKALDVGMTEAGRPYFVMELVKGMPITQYCDEHNLSPRERLEMFVPLCLAVQHAHQKGVIHRDIKPSNILVAEYDNQPVPKIIDFGVAKALNQQLTERTMFTQYGQIIGTLEYMSPEQAKINQLDVDTRSDIYSLGVVLYELLTGTTPFDKERLRTAAMDELMKIIREEEPPRPSIRLSSMDTLPSVAASRKTEPRKLSLLLRGELDWIVMKALDKERARRYETASAMADDVRRYLNDDAVVACPPSVGYRFRKFAKRNKTAISTVTIVILALLLGLAGTVYEASKRRRAEDSRAEAVELRMVAEREHRLAKQNLAEATRQRTIAEKKAIEASDQRRIAEEQRAEALKQREIADEQRIRAMKAEAVAVEAKAQAENDASVILEKLRIQLLDKVLIYAMNGEEKLAESVLDDAKAAKLDPLLEAIVVGQSHLWNGKYESAAQHLKRAISLDEKSYAARAGYAIAVSADHAAFAAAIQGMQHVSPETPYDYLFGANTLTWSSPEQALRWLENTGPLKESAFGRFVRNGALANSSFLQPDRRYALEALEDAIQIRKMTRDSAISLTMDLYSRMTAINERRRQGLDDNANALNECKKVCEHLHKYRDIYFAGRTRAWFLGDFSNTPDQALSEWNHRIALDPKGTDFLHYAAVAYLSGQRNDALQILGGPGESEITHEWIARAYLLATQRDGHDECTAICNTILNTVPSPSEVCAVIEILLLMGDKPAAQKVARSHADSPSFPRRYRLTLTYVLDQMPKEEYREQFWDLMGADTTLTEFNADFVIGLYALADANANAKVEAQKHFAKCREMGMFPASWYWWAKSFLEQSKRDESWPQWIPSASGT